MYVIQTHQGLAVSRVNPRFYPLNGSDTAPIRFYRKKGINKMKTKREMAQAGITVAGVVIGIFVFIVSAAYADRSLKTSEKVTVPRHKVAQEPGKTIINSIGMAFVYIKPGTFMMGSPPNELDRKTDETLHQVTLTKGFYMQTTVVTQGQWKRVMNTNPSYFKNCGDDCPVENVSWNDAKAFIQKLNSMEGHSRYRLPTEAEWEYSCRAGCVGPYANGNTMIHLDKMGWFSANSERKIHPVGQKKPNAWGLYDMHGNVSEWCQDWYGNYPSGSVTDPVGPPSGPGRVRRGGAWCYEAWNCRSAIRFRNFDGGRGFSLGFRLAHGVVPR